MPVISQLTIDKLKKRIEGQKEWLKPTNCHKEQKHIDEGTVERVYWHYGYCVALSDVIRLIEREQINGI